MEFRTLRKYFVATFALVMLLTAALPSFAWDVADEIRRLNKEAPSIEVYKGAPAVVWLIDNNFKMLADGTMENAQKSIVMMGENIPASWREMIIPVAENGDVVVEEAAWYNPMTAMKEGDLAVEKRDAPGGGKAVAISVPQSAAGRIVVMSVRKTFSKRYGADGAIAMAGPLPRWEQRLAVEIPDGMKLHWAARDVSKPTLTRQSGVLVYTWKAMNQEPWHGAGFVEYKRPIVTFSFKNGIVQALSNADDYGAITKVPPMPDVVKGMDKNRAAARLAQWMKDPKMLLAGYPKEWVRRADELPAQGPWTPWEQTLIMNKWFNQLGIESAVWWSADSELDKDIPATMGVWTAPVLYTSAGGKKTFYQPGEHSELGVTPVSIEGMNVYHKKDGTSFEKKLVSSGSPSDHKLSLLWLLNFSDKVSNVNGTLQVRVTGAWTDLFSDRKLPDMEQITNIIGHKLSFAMPGMTLRFLKQQQFKNGYTLEFQVERAPAIIQGKNMLLRLPGGIPVSVSELLGTEESYTLRFPFVIEQRVRMKMPSGYKLIQMPPIGDQGTGSKAVLKESLLHWPKKGELIADSVWIIKTRAVDPQLARIIKSELSAFMRWPIIDLPFTKK